MGLVVSYAGAIIENLYTTERVTTTCVMVPCQLPFVLSDLVVNPPIMCVCVCT